MTTAFALEDSIVFSREPNDNDYPSRVAVLSDGGYIIVWRQAQGSDTGDILAQRFDAGGQPVGAEFRAHAQSFGVQGVGGFSVTGLTTGGFVVTWQNESMLDDLSGSSVRAQVFDAAGAKVGTDFLVNTSTARNQTDPVITALEDGRFVIGWLDFGRLVNYADVKAKIFDDTGQALTPELTLVLDEPYGELPYLDFENLEISRDFNGGFAITLDRLYVDRDPAIFRFTALGQDAGFGGLSATLAGNGNQVRPDVAGLTNGTVVMVYTDLTTGDVRFGIQYFDPEWGPGYSVGAVSTPGAANGDEARVEALQSGGFIVTYLETDGAGSEPAQMARLFNADGTPLGQPFVVAESAPRQGYGDVVQLADGDLEFTWTAYNASASDFDVVRQRWGLFGDVYGTEAGDTLIGTSARDAIQAYGESDVVFGGASGDWIDGGDGNDELSGDDGDDQLFGGVGVDVLLGGDGDDVLDASGATGGVNVDLSPDELVGGDGDDTASYARGIAGVAADLMGTVPAVNEASGDTYLSIENLRGTGFGDQLAGDDGGNTLTGLGGLDVLIGRGGADLLLGGADTDTASYYDAPAGVVADLESVTIGAGDATGDIFDSIEILDGSNFADTLRGTVGAQTLIGNPGDDVLEGRGGGDTLTGGAGNDAASYTLSGSGVTADLGTIENNTGDAAGDTYSAIEGLLGSAFADTLRGDGGGNTLNGGGGGDILLGRGGADDLSGGAGADLLMGEDADDVLDGGADGDTLIGGSGIDRLLGGTGADVLDGGIGVDIADFREKTSSVLLTLNGSVLVTAFIGGVAEDSLRNIEQVFGGTVGDALIGDALANSLFGFGGDDVLIGRGGLDTLVGGLGMDIADYRAESSAVSVTLNLGTNAGVTIGGVLADNLREVEAVYGGTAGDTLTGDSGANLFRGGGGFDVMNGAGGSDTVDFGDKALAVLLTLNTVNVANATVGGVTEDSVRNIENIVGGKAGDALTGDGLANRLTGGLGADTLTGAGNADVFVYRAIGDSTVASAGRDTITDFSSAQGDRIDLSAIDANATLAGDQAFVIGTIGVAGRISISANGPDSWLIRGDVDGGGTDFMIAVDSTTAPTAADFVL